MYQVFGLTNEEYDLLSKKYINLCRSQSWDLLRRNIHNNHLNDFEDIMQEQMAALIKAGVYYKRQTYIESCLEVCEKYAKGTKKKLIEKLKGLWSNKTRHGANKQTFGDDQEEILNQLVLDIVPEAERPDVKKPLVIDDHFAIYCKGITWNQQKNLGKKITRERSLRVGAVSLSSFDFLGGDLCAG